MTERRTTQPTACGRQRQYLQRTLPLLIIGLLPIRVVAAEPVQFSVLSYNTHGLPAWIARDEPGKRFPVIAKLARAYDINLFQENFVDSDFQLLSQGLAGRFLQRGNGNRRTRPDWLSSFCGSCGSGLTAAVNQRLQTKLLGRRGYGSCSGWIGGANDCWANKGYLALRLSLENSAGLDVYDLHLDAGPAATDHEARRRQLEVLRAAIAELSRDRAVIVAGDFNLDTGRERDQELLEWFASELHLLHSGATGQDQWAEHLDYILYRSGAGTQLTVLAAGEAGEFQIEGVPLSDHPAVFARFEARAHRIGDQTTLR